MRKKYLFLLPFVLCLSLSSCTEQKQSAQESPIYNGNLYDSHEGVGGIFHFDTFDLNANKYLSCTAVEIGNRCILTAAHCMPMTFAYELYTQAEEFTAGTFIPPIRRKIHPSYVYTAGGTNANSAVDLQVMWMGDRKCKTPMNAYGNQTSWHCNEAAGLANWIPQDLAPPPPVNTNLTIYGYGYNNLSLAPGKTGIVSSGTMKVDNIFTGGPALGKLLNLVPNSTLPHDACSGDSGGPAYHGDSVVGIASVSNCQNSSGYTAFANGNQVWVNTQIEDFCKPGIYLKVSVQGAAGSGLNWGYKSPGWIENDVIYDNLRTIYCISPNVGANSGTPGPCAPGQLGHYDEDTDSCMEFGVCEFNNMPNQEFWDPNFIITAKPAAGKKFVEWKHGTSGQCPCIPEQTTSPSCNIDAYDYPLNYGSSNLETASCVAVFGPQ